MSAFLCLLLLIAPMLERDDASPEDEAVTQLAKVRRIYIDILTGGDAALKIRDLLMTSLQGSRQFIITEDEDKADATLKGTGADEVFTDTFQSSEGLNAHTQVGGGANGSTRTTSSRYAGLGIGETSSRHTEERKHEAIATVRLVNKDGDVIWSATAESLGGKFLGASADVADKIAKRLVLDYKAAKKQTAK
ncbi:MAG TPA: hypothetical protein VEU96_11410 [Bryobacteraceae bacterium]|nr:hypothetical protein [Bryobacteraceae bacterium]